MDRKKLKDIANSVEVPEGAGLIIRTAGSQRTKAEIKRDYEYLQRMWEQIRELTLKSIAPSKIYEEGDLIKRSIRDLYSKDIDEVIVAGEGGYRTAKDFMKMIMPSHSKNVKIYGEQMPLFARYQVEGYLSGMFSPTVQLPSGGYIVIGVTEALVAIDVNSGRATKEGSIEQTALKTNLEASDEIARQLRLRDLAGLIVIDYIDMDERKNNAAVEKRFKDKLKTDRARIQVGRISGFGLLEMSRQRLRPGMLEATTQQCPHCHGTGLLRSDDNVALNILRQLEEEGTRDRTKEVLVKAPVGIANFLMNGKREHIAAIEARYGMAVRIECDPFMISPDFAMEKFKTATRIVPDALPFISPASLVEDDDDDLVVEETPDDEDDAVAEAAPQSEQRSERRDEQRAETENGDGEGQPKKKRRRRRRRRGGAGNGEGQNGQSQNDADGDDDATTEAAGAAPVAEVTAEAEAPKPKPRTRSRTAKKKPEDDTGETAAVATAPDAEPASKPKATRSRSRAKPKVEDAAATEIAAAPPGEPAAAPEAAKPAPKKRAPSASRAKAAAEAAVEPAAETANADAAPAEDKPKRKGWWSLGR